MIKQFVVHKWLMYCLRKQYILKVNQSLACIFYFIFVPHISQLIAEGANARSLNK